MFFRLLPLLVATTCVVWAAPAPRALPPQTRAQIETLLRAPEIQSAHVGVAVVALGEATNAAQFAAKPYDGGAQPLLFGIQENKRFLPASNMKLFTGAWVLSALKPETRLQTQVLSAPVEFVDEGSWPRTMPDPIVVTLVGGGDPSFGLEGVDDLAIQIAKLKPSGVVVRAQNAALGDELNGENGGNRYPDGWTLDDALWYYGAPVTGLSFERNQVDLTLTGTSPGQIAKLEWSPGPIALPSSTKPDAAPDFIWAFNTFNLVTTTEKGDPRAGNLSWDRGDRTSPLGPTLTIRGFLAPGQSLSEGIAVPDAREWARRQFEAALRRQNVNVLDLQIPFTTGRARVVATHLSAPVGTLMKRFLKNSDNLYGEMLLRRAGLVSSTRAEKPDFQIASTRTAARAHNAMAAWLKQNDVPTQGLRLSDGSGLSRYNLVTPISVARLLGAAQSREFYEALPIAGVDGTLKNRMKSTRAAGNVRAKTGTFSVVNCLSGYVTTLDGQRMAVSILTNGAENGELARTWQGRVFEALAQAQFRKNKRKSTAKHAKSIQRDSSWRAWRFNSSIKPRFAGGKSSARSSSGAHHFHSATSKACTSPEIMRQSNG